MGHLFSEDITDSEISAFLIGFAANGIDLNLNIWVPDPEEGSAELKSQIYMAIWRAFKQHNISIPFPQMDVRLLNTSSAQLQNHV